MSKQINIAVKIVLFFGLGIFLLWYSMRDISPAQWEEIRNSFKDIRYGWLLLSALLGIASHLSRAARWQSLLATFDHKPGYINTFFALMIGYFGNMVFPRLGEAARCAIIHRYEKITLDKVLGTVIVDRALDLLTLAILLLVVLLWQYELIGDYFMSAIWPPMANKFSALISGNNFILLLIPGTAVLLFYLFRQRFTRFIGTIQKIVLSFAQGLLSIKRVNNLPLFIGHSIFIWLMYFLMIYVCFYSVSFTGDLGPQVALVILVMGTFGMIATPGGIGAYPALVAVVMGLYGKAYNLSIGFGTLIWSLQYILTLAVGFLCVIGMPLINRKEHEPPLSTTAQTN